MRFNRTIVFALIALVIVIAMIATGSWPHLLIAGLYIFLACWLAGAILLAIASLADKPE